MKDEDLLLTDEEIARSLNLSRGILPSLVDMRVAKAQLAKARPIIEKPLHKKIDKLQAKLVTTNVYYLKELREAQKQERERILKLMLMRDVGGINPEWALSDKQYQLLKGEK